MFFHLGIVGIKAPNTLVYTRTIDDGDIKETGLNMLLNTRLVADVFNNHLFPRVFTQYGDLLDLDDVIISVYYSNFQKTAFFKYDKFGVIKFGDFNPANTENLIFGNEMWI